MPSAVAAGSDELADEDWEDEADDVLLEEVAGAGWAAEALRVGADGLDVGRNAGDVEEILKDMEAGSS